MQGEEFKQLERYFKYIKWLVLVGFSLTLLGWCKYKDNYSAPASNTEAYRAQHGVYRGKPSELKIGGVLFRFPAEYMPEPYTETRDVREIVKGKAERAKVFIDLSTGKPLPTTRRAEGANVVRIEINNSGYEADKNIENYFQKWRWKSINDRPELGLREYVKDSVGGWGEVTYEPLDPKIKTPRGGRFIFLCVGVTPEKPGGCMSYFQHPRGPQIKYYFGPEFFPDWKSVNAEVVKFVDALIVE